MLDSINVAGAIASLSVVIKAQGMIVYPHYENNLPELETHVIWLFQSPIIQNMHVFRISVVLLATPAFAGVLDHREDPQPTLTPQYAKRYLYNSDKG